MDQKQLKIEFLEYSIKLLDYRYKERDANALCHVYIRFVYKNNDVFFNYFSRAFSGAIPTLERFLPELEQKRTIKHGLKWFRDDTERLEALRSTLKELKS